MLQVQLQGVPGSSVFPPELVVEPGQRRQYTITVRLPEEGRPEQGRLALSFTSPTQRVIVQGSQVELPFKKEDNKLLLALAVGAAVVAGVGLLFYLRMRRPKQPAPTALRRMT